jgi:hypothetical protein
MPTQLVITYKLERLKCQLFLFQTFDVLRVRLLLCGWLVVFEVLAPLFRDAALVSLPCFVHFSHISIPETMLVR